ncbi:MAG: hypothetical protein ABR574_00815 [Cryomorphaceae bacterium]|nr:hypothetical protein [Flavobacteriales bacterium]
MDLKKYLGIALMAVALWSCGENEPKKQKSNDVDKSPKQEQKSAPAQDAAPSGEADEYGRMPGDEHYGHDHPPASQQQQQDNPMFQKKEAPTGEDLKNGEADEYGRMPGDEHYGHNHPPQDQDQKNPMKVQQGDDSSGETDDYGRKPGDEHYGHDHP